MKQQKVPTAVIEGEVNIGPGHIIEAYVYLTGKINGGKGCYFGTGCCVRGPVTVGDHVFFGEKTSIGFPTQSQIQLFQQDERKVPWENSNPTRIGDFCVIRAGSVIYAGVTLGNNVRVGHNALIREQVNIGNNTLVGTGVVIDGKSSIGNKVSIQSNAYIPLNTQIEDHVFLGPHCILTNDKYVMRQKTDLKGPIIRRGASIGAGAVILPSVEVGAEAVIGAGAVVTKDVPPKSVVYGVPAKLISTIPSNWNIPLG